jgi:hypothetical protein
MTKPARRPTRNRTTRTPVPTVPALVEPARRILRREIATFLTIMVTEQPERNWPALPPSELIDALADALVDMSGSQSLGLAMLQTLVYELQDKIDRRLASPHAPKD